MRQFTYVMVVSVFLWCAMGISSGTRSRQRLTAGRAEAERFGFDGTPAFVINGVSLVGNHPITDFERIIEFVVSAAQGKTDWISVT